MKMKANDVLTKYEFLSRILLKSESGELSKDLKVKLIAMRVEYGKIKREYDADFKEFAQGLLTPEFEALRDKQDKSEEEMQEWNKMISDFNSSYNKYVIERINEDITVSNKTLTPEDLEEIITVNADTEVDINGNHFSAGDFLENISILFS